MPDVSLECSSNVLHIHTCVDSCVALRDLLVYLATDGDLRPWPSDAAPLESREYSGLALRDSPRSSLVSDCSERKVARDRCQPVSFFALFQSSYSTSLGTGTLPIHTAPPPTSSLPSSSSHPPSSSPDIGDLLSEAMDDASTSPPPRGHYSSSVGGSGQSVLQSHHMASTAAAAAVAGEGEKRDSKSRMQVSVFLCVYCMSCVHVFK